MTGVSLLGPWPGTEVLEAQTVVVGELAAPASGLTGVPSLVELPQRGPHAGPAGRAAAVLVDVPVELGPHGWRLADRPGADLLRCRSALTEDLDALAIAAHGYAGPLALAVRGPWSLAATLDLARGDRVLSDAGAVRDLVASLGEGLAGLLGRLRVAVPGAEPVVVLREPVLDRVIGGGVETFSGAGRFPAVPAERVSGALAELVGRVRALGGTTLVHAVTASQPTELAALAGAGAEGLGCAAAGMSAAGWEAVATAVEGGTRLWSGLSPAAAGSDAVRTAADAVTGPWRALGLPASGLADVVVHVEGGDGSLLRAGPAGARDALRHAVRVAGEVAERAEG